MVNVYPQVAPDLLKSLRGHIPFRRGCDPVAGFGVVRALRVVLTAIISCVFFSVLFAQDSPPTISIQILVVGSQTEAQSVLGRLQRGEDFAVLAKQLSTDNTASDGGNMGKVNPMNLRPEIRDALQGLAPGEMSGIVHLPSGFAILKLLSIQAAAAQSSSGTDNSRILPHTAASVIRYQQPVGGKGEADLGFRSIPKPDGWSQDLQLMCKLRQQSLDAVIGVARENLDPNNPQGSVSHPPLDRIQMHYALANLHAYKGEMDPAIEQWLQAYKIAQTEMPAAMSDLEETLGIAYLHKSEMDNDIYRNPGDRCIFPPRASVSYDKTAASEKAIEFLSKYLQRHPDATDGKWEINLAYMTLGKYPAGVPKQYLIPPSAFDSPEDVPRFRDVAPDAGINTYSMSGGLIVDDFENNGQLDIVTSDFGQCAPMHYFHNNGDGSFSDHTAQSGLSSQLGGLNMVQADYNNDGCIDILVLRGAWEFPQRKSLLRNNCNGTFTDVTAAAGLAEPAADTQAGVWADIDNDGLLDLFVANEDRPAQLFRNRGDGTFEDISHKAGIDRVAYSKAVVAADYDNDGYVDFYVSNLNGNNFLYHNNHDGTFTEVAAQAGVQKPWQSFPAWFFDYDNDGLPDLFVSSYYVSVDENIRSYLGLASNAETLKLYKNMGDGTFRDVTQEVGLDRVFMPMGSNFGDIDNDGFLDSYLGTGNPSYGSLLPNVLLHNKEGKFFTDVTAASGTGELHKGHGVAFADVERDGSEDLLEEVGGAVPGDAHAFRLFQNPGNGNDWLNLKLTGVKSNRSAIGTRIKVTVENEGKAPRSIYRTVASGGSFGASPLEQHIGLGKSARIVNVEIWWPASNTRQNFANIEKNQFLEIKELAANYTRLDRKSFRLGATHSNAAVLDKQ
jgi:tetratricopeptide (TPR) repeat protein